LLRTDASVQAAQDAEVAADRILERTRLVPYGASLARSLPYGHQRVLELGIALAARPSLLLLDEPAAGLNPAEVSDLMALIQRIRHEGVTVVLVEHDMKLVMSVSDRVVVLDHGRKIAEGRPEEIRTNQRVVEAYLGKRG
jgi:branched-chain amino acid transport system ATP-binding protein